MTYDDDLLSLHAAGATHAGIAYSALRRRSIGRIVMKLVALSRRFGPDDMTGRVEYL